MLFKLISLSNFESEITEEKKPVLLAYIRRDHDYKEQTDVLYSISKNYGGALKVCMLDEDSFDAFGVKLGIEGDPTFIGYYNGKEKGRILGKTDRETLISFVSRNLYLIASYTSE